MDKQRQFFLLFKSAYEQLANALGRTPKIVVVEEHTGDKKYTVDLPQTKNIDDSSIDRQFFQLHKIGIQRILDAIAGQRDIEIPRSVLEELRGERGEDGDDADEEEIIERILPVLLDQIPTAQQVAALIPPPKPGEPGAPGKNADEKAVEDRVVGRITPLIPTVEQVLSKVPFPEKKVLDLIEKNKPTQTTPQDVVEYIRGREKIIPESALDIDWKKHVKGSIIRQIFNSPNGGSGVRSIVAGDNITVDDTDPYNPVVSASGGDRYKTTSTTSHTIVSTGELTFTVDSGLAYTILQDISIVHDESNYMSGHVVSYSGTTLVVDIQHKTGAGTYSSWTINLDGVPVDAISGSGTVNELAYFTASKVLASLSTATYPSLTELTYLKGVTSSIQTQLNGKQASGTYVTGATNTTLTLTGTTLGLNLSNANTWSGAITLQVGTNADGVFQIKNSGGSNRFGYSTSKDQLSVGDGGYNASAGFFYIYDVTHSFKDVFSIVKGTWGSAFDIYIATLSPVVKATGGSTFVSYTINDVGTYLYNAAVSGSTFDIRNDTDNYGTYGFYAKGYNNNPTPSSFGAQKRAVSYGVVGEAQSNATGHGGAGLRSYSASPNIDGVRVDVLSGQTAPLFRARLVNSFYDAFITSATDIMTIDSKGCINPASMADSAAANNSIYYSTTQSKLVYKDSGGTVNNLY